MYELFEHTADLGLRVVAPELNTLFAEGAQALFSAIVTDLAQVEPRQEVRLELEGTDIDYLYFDWLNELLYLSESQGLLLSQFEVRVDERGLKAVARGEPIDRGRHQFDHEVKAITYHELKVEPCDGGWLAEVIVDI